MQVSIPGLKLPLYSGEVMSSTGDEDVCIMLFCCPLLLGGFPDRLSECPGLNLGPPWVNLITFVLCRSKHFKRRRVDKGAVKHLHWEYGQ